MKFNVDKCRVMHLRRENLGGSYVMPVTLHLHHFKRHLHHIQGAFCSISWAIGHRKNRKGWFSPPPPIFMTAFIVAKHEIPRREIPRHEIPRHEIPQT